MPRRGRSRVGRLAGLSRVEPLESRRLLATFTVTSNADSGPGTLRDAIAQVNADKSSGVDTIDFNIGAGGLQTIAVKTGLGEIDYPVLIDGTSQPGTSITPRIELNGASAGAGADGLTIFGGDSTVRGLVVDGFRPQIDASGHAQPSGGVGIDLLTNGGETVAGCFLGTNAAGTAASGNYIGIRSITGYGVSSYSGNVNSVGGTSIHDRNVISGNSIGIESGPALIQGNYIGTDLAGLHAIPNITGIQGDLADTIGGTASGSGNLISGNSGDGIYAQDLGTVAEGNSIGIAADGTPLGNAHDGVVLTGFDNSLSFTRQSAPVGSTIGGTAAGAANTIADNGGDGVSLLPNMDIYLGFAVRGVSIRGNSIHDNGGVGIDFDGEGPLPDVGAPSTSDYNASINRFEPYPVLTSAAISAGSATIAGTLDSTPGTSYEIDLYANSAPGYLGFGQGRDYLGSITAISNAAGHVSFSTSVPDPSGLADFTATATDPLGDTSEFSRAFVRGQALPSADLSVVASASPKSVIIGQTATITYVVTNLGPDPAPETQLIGSDTAGSREAVTSATVGTVNVTNDYIGAAPIPIGTLGVGQSATLTVVYDTGYLVTGAFGGTAEAFGLNPDPDPANSSASAVVTITPPPAPVLGITVSSSPTKSREGLPITFTVLIANSGNAPATNATAVVQSPPGISTYATSRGTSTLVDNVITADLGTIDAGQSATITVVVIPTTAGPLRLDAGFSGGNLFDHLTVPSTDVPSDFFGTGKSDLAIYLPSIGAFAIRPPSGADVIVPFGLAGAGQTLPALGDYFGDGKIDIAAYLPSIGALAVRPDNGGADAIIPFGIPGAGQTIPAPGDYLGDGKTEIAVYLTSIGAFAIRPDTGGADRIIPFGIAGAGQSIPAPGDYNGDGTTDLAIYLPSIGAFAYRPSAGGPDQVIPFGIAGAGQSIPMPGDYDGSGKTELAVYLPAYGLFAYRPAGGGPDVVEPFGIAGAGQSIPAPGDYEGDGKTDLAIYLPSIGAFAVRPSSGGADQITPFGIAGAGQSLPVTAIDPATTPGGVSAAAVRSEAISPALAATTSATAPAARAGAVPASRLATVVGLAPPSGPASVRKALVAIAQGPGGGGWKP